MNDLNYKAILDSIPLALVFCNTEHIITFMNATAIERYKDRNVTINDSIFDCHEEKDSHEKILEAYSELKNGKSKALMYESKEKEGQKGYLIGVRNSNKELIGYWEKIEEN
ncbi:MAG: hypothetical protein ACXAC7_10990 [Candidatus Hodarchaeales archaeon]|jgi:hypothetical protein